MLSVDREFEKFGSDSPRRRRSLATTRQDVRDCLIRWIDQRHFNSAVRPDVCSSTSWGRYICVFFDAFATEFPPPSPSAPLVCRSLSRYKIGSAGCERSKATRYSSKFRNNARAISKRAIEHRDSLEEQCAVLAYARDLAVTLEPLRATLLVKTESRASNFDGFSRMKNIAPKYVYKRDIVDRRMNSRIVQFYCL